MGTVIKHPVQDRVKPSFVIFDIRALWRSDLSSVLRPRQHSIGYMGDGFYRSKDPTDIIKVLKEDLQKTKQTTKTTKYTNAQTIIETQKDIHKIMQSYHESIQVQFWSM